MFKRAISVLISAFAATVLVGCSAPEPSPKTPSTRASVLPGSGRMVVLMITDNIDHVNGSGPGSIAAGVTGNAVRMKDFFSQVANATSQQLDLREIVGSSASTDPFNCDNINQTIRTLPVAKDDVAIIYYAGHGFNLGALDPSAMAIYAVPEFANTKSTDMPFLYCGPQNRNSVNLDMIAAWLTPKQPRLSLVIADACNSFENGTGPAPQPFAPAAAPAAIAEDLRLISLFREAEGNVMIGGAEVNHYSFYETGVAQPMGFATRQFLDDVIGKMSPSQRASWVEVKGRFFAVPVTTIDPVTQKPGKFLQKPILREGPPFVMTTTPVASLH
jgi:hypothetical protein